MKVAIFGLGYVGFTAACCIASEGHSVVGVDVSDAKIEDIRKGRSPFEEPGLTELMQGSLDAGTLTVTKSAAEALDAADLAIVCVGTPSGSNGAHDMRYIADVSRQISAGLREIGLRPITISYRSTMRPGSMRTLIAPIYENILGEHWCEQIEFAYNPEFLREAQAIDDYFNPARVVIGTKDGASSKVMEKLHKNIDAPIFRTRYEEAEIIKFVDNSWHATKVAFANEIGRVCAKLNTDASVVHKIFVADTKLNISPYYTRPGGAFGGSCLPKDVRALQYIASDIGANTHLLDSLLRSNEAQKNHTFDNVIERISAGEKVLIVGLAFKADTDDLRESPNVDLARKLLEAGVALKVFDPKLEPSRLRGQNLGYTYSALPTIDQLLISKQEVDATTWDLIVVTNATGEQLDLKGKPTFSTHSMNQA